MLHRSMCVELLDRFCERNSDMTPAQMMAMNTKIAKLMIDTQAVMALRLMGMAGALPARSDENNRMVVEKGPAFAKAMTEVTAAAIAGKRPDQIMSAGIKPLQVKVSSNRKRLTK